MKTTSAIRVRTGQAAAFIRSTESSKLLFGASAIVDPIKVAVVRKVGPAAQVEKLPFPALHRFGYQLMAEAGSALFGRCEARRGRFPPPPSAGSRSGGELETAAFRP